MKLLVLNGPNINMLGIREKEIYGHRNYDDLVRMIEDHCKNKNVEVDILQSNCEGKLVTFIQQAYQKYDGIVINPGAYTHTSIAILDALKAVDIPTAEVHISNVDEREEFRKISFVSLVAKYRVIGKGLEGYLEAIDLLLNK